METKDISEVLAAAYAIHCSDSSIAGHEPVKYEEFYEYYKKHIQDFRNLTGAAEPYTG